MNAARVFWIVLLMAIGIGCFIELATHDAEAAPYPTRQAFRSEEAAIFCGILPHLLTARPGHEFQAMRCNYIRFDRMAQEELFRVWFYDVTRRARRLYTVCAWADTMAETVPERVSHVGDIGRSLC